MFRGHTSGVREHLPLVTVGGAALMGAAFAMEPLQNPQPAAQQAAIIALPSQASPVEAAAQRAIMVIPEAQKRGAAAMEAAAAPMQTPQEQNADAVEQVEGTPAEDAPVAPEAAGKPVQTRHLRSKSWKFGNLGSRGAGGGGRKLGAGLRGAPASAGGSGAAPTGYSNGSPSAASGPNGAAEGGSSGGEPTGRFSTLNRLSRMNAAIAPTAEGGGLQNASGVGNQQWAGADRENGSTIRGPQVLRVQRDSGPIDRGDDNQVDPGVAAQTVAVRSDGTGTHDATVWRRLVAIATKLMKIAGTLMLISSILAFIGKQLAKTMWGAAAGIAMLNAARIMAMAVLPMAAFATGVGLALMFGHGQWLPGGIMTVAGAALTYGAWRAMQGDKKAAQEARQKIEAERAAADARQAEAMKTQVAPAQESTGTATQTQPQTTAQGQPQTPELKTQPLDSNNMPGEKVANPSAPSQQPLESRPIGSNTSQLPKAPESRMPGQTVQTTPTSPGNATVTHVDGQKAIQYPDGSTKIGGSPAWRNNNPGNIEYGDWAKSHGAIGSDGRFAIFPDSKSGQAALDSLLRNNTYQNSSVAEAIGRYAPKSENNTAGYLAKLLKGIGITDPNTKLKDLSQSQFDALKKVITRVEGTIPGKVG